MNIEKKDFKKVKSKKEHLSNVREREREREKEKEKEKERKRKRE
jgi:hypothetical protein